MADKPEDKAKKAKEDLEKLVSKMKDINEGKATKPAIYDWALVGAAHPYFADGRGTAKGKKEYSGKFVLATLMHKYINIFGANADAIVGKLEGMDSEMLDDMAIGAAGINSKAILESLADEEEISPSTILSLGRKPMGRITGRVMEKLKDSYAMTKDNVTAMQKFLAEKGYNDAKDIYDSDKLFEKVQKYALK